MGDVLQFPHNAEVGKNQLQYNLTTASIITTADVEGLRAHCVSSLLSAITIAEMMLAALRPLIVKIPAGETRGQLELQQHVIMLELSIVRERVTYI